MEKTIDIVGFGFAICAFILLGFALGIAFSDSEMKESNICMYKHRHEEDFCKVWSKCNDNEPPKKYCKRRYYSKNP